MVEVCECEPPFNISRSLLAFLAPDIIEAILAGKQPSHLTTQMLTRQINIPLDWEEQKCLLI